MIEPNWNLMLWVILIMWVSNVVLGIPSVIISWGEEKKYGAGDVVSIILTALVVAAVLLM